MSTSRIEKEKIPKEKKKKKDGTLTLELALGGVLDNLLDLLVASALLKTTGEVNDGDVGSGHAQRHARQLAVEVRDNLANGLSSASAAGDDVLRRSAAPAPVLGRGAVNGLLGSGVRVHSGHEALDNGELVVEHLGEGRKAVGGARGVGDDGGLAIVRLLVDAHHVHGGIGGGRRDDDPLGAALQMGASLLRGGEDTSRLNDVLGASLLPGDGSGVALLVELDLLTVDNKAVVGDLDGALEDAVGRIILEHVLLDRLLVSGSGKIGLDMRRLCRGVNFFLFFFFIFLVLPLCLHFRNINWAGVVSIFRPIFPAQFACACIGVNIGAGRWWAERAVAPLILLAGHTTLRVWVGSNRKRGKSCRPPVTTPPCPSCDIIPWMASATNNNMPGRYMQDKE